MPEAAGVAQGYEAEDEAGDGEDHGGHGPVHECEPGAKCAHQRECGGPYPLRTLRSGGRLRGDGFRLIGGGGLRGSGFRLIGGSFRLRSGLKVGFHGLRSGL